MNLRLLRLSFTLFIRTFFVSLLSARLFSFSFLPLIMVFCIVLAILVGKVRHNRTEYQIASVIARPKTGKIKVKDLPRV